MYLGITASRPRDTLFAAGLLSLAAAGPALSAADGPGVAEFRRDIQPLLVRYCFDCHGDGMRKGKVAFDGFPSDETLLSQQDLWHAVLKNVRAGIMPPPGKPRPSTSEKERLVEWIKTAVFGIDPGDPDPGRVTIRRLNRNEYRNTIRDLMGIDFDADIEFPPDDTGHGFDNIGEVLTLSPMLIEKYLSAAKTIVERAVPTVSRVMAETRIPGSRFRRADGTAAGGRPGEGARDGSEALPYYEPASVSQSWSVPHDGRYRLLLDLTANEKFVDRQFDYNKCRLIFRADGQELLQQECAREAGKRFHFEFDRDWQAGEHALALEIVPLTPGEKQVRSLSIRLDSVTVRGPAEEKRWVQPKDYQRFFLRDPSAEPSARREHAREVLASFTTKAFRRPVDAGTVDRLADLAEDVYRRPGKSFEAGIAQAMVAILASPRFLFREEKWEPREAGRIHPFVDEHALASRLSYFLWSSMPDDELFGLAAERKLRANLTAQFRRMLADPRSASLMRNFTGQWLQARDIENVEIDARAVMSREAEPDPELEKARRRFRELRQKDPESLSAAEKEELEKARAAFFRSFGRFNRFELNGPLRQAMRLETEKWFEHVVREDRSLLELLDSDSTFLNKRLADQYGVPGVEGDELRLVRLPADSPRGGILTQGTMLAVTSNPSRTSPVKRGLFILENVFGAPPPPPPPDVPALEDAAKGFSGRDPTLRETLALHRGKPLCASCHNRMDPLGLALENFNALGRWREKERGQPIDTAGKLITGESFAGIKELKRILVQSHRDDFYRCLTEKLLTYAIGRGLEYHDVETVDRIVERIRKEDGRASALLLGIIESTPFQKRRYPTPEERTREY